MLKLCISEKIICSGPYIRIPFYKKLAPQDTVCAGEHKNPNGIYLNLNKYLWEQLVLLDYRISLLDKISSLSYKLAWCDY